MEYPKQVRNGDISTVPTTPGVRTNQRCERTCTCGGTGSSGGCGADSPYRVCKADSAVNGTSGPPPLHGNSTQNSDTFISSDTSLSVEVQNQILARQVSQLEREKKDAFRQVKEVTKMNTRWQKYDKEREAVVVDLTLKCRNTEEKVHQQEMMIHTQQEKIEELELLWTDARVRAAERKAELDRVQRELQSRIEALELNLRQSESRYREVNKKLEKRSGHREDEAEKKRSTEKDRELYQMSKRVLDLKEKVQHLEHQLTTVQKQMDEQADLYTQQISICLEDFKHEKKDKDRIQKENEELKKRLKAAEDFASSLRVEITKYENQQKGMAHRRHQPLQKYLADLYDEPLSHSWDDAGFSLPSTVVRDVLPYDEVDTDVPTPVHIEPDNPLGAAGPAPVEPPPQYDDKSVLGHVIYPKVVRNPKQFNGTNNHPAELVLH